MLEKSFSLRMPFSHPGCQHLCKVGCFFLLGRDCIIPFRASPGCHKLTLGQEFLSFQRPSKVQHTVGSIWKTCRSQSFNVRLCLVRPEKLHKISTTILTIRMTINRAVMINIDLEKCLIEDGTLERASYVTHK